ncbi:MAG: hypothetical protein KDK89_19880, partial [Alphaproteobacteria bacterium]|nr:hypothetical protein [Alphaproteobacteria bacterium]
MPVKTYSAGMRQRVAFAISMSLNFDYYLFDEIGAGGDRQFREVASKMIKERLATSKFIITSHRHDELINLCDAGIVIMGGELTYFPDIRDALAFYGEPIEESSEAKGKPAAAPKSSKAVKPAPPAEAPAPKVAAKVKAPKPGTATRAPRPGALAAATRPAAGANADQVLADFLKRRSTTAKAEAPAAEDSKPPPAAEAVRKPALAARRQKAQPPKSAALTAQDLAAIKASRALEQLLQIIDGKPTHGSGEEHHEAIARTRTAQTQAAAAAARARIAAAAESAGHSNPSAPPPPRGQRPDGIPARNQNQDRRRARRAQAAAPAGRIEAGTDRP